MTWSLNFIGPVKNSTTAIFKNHFGCAPMVLTISFVDLSPSGEDASINAQMINSLPVVIGVKRAPWPATQMQGKRLYIRSCLVHYINSSKTRPIVYSWCWVDVDLIHLKLNLSCHCSYLRRRIGSHLPITADFSRVAKVFRNNVKSKLYCLNGENFTEKLERWRSVIPVLA